MQCHQEGDVLVRTLYVSLDPSSRVWTNAEASYLPPVELGDVMRGESVGVVEQSLNSRFKEGDLVAGASAGWCTYKLIPKGAGLHRLPSPAESGIPSEAYVGFLNFIGATAYFGLLDITDPKEGETLVVDAAAGAVGSLVGQIGKIKGMRVIGICGSEDKCRWITEELGFDGAINYRTENVRKSLGVLCPDGVDVVFENVGGTIFDDILAHINIGARISLCGLISSYNSTKPVPGPYRFGQILVKRATVKGFIVLDYVPRFAEAMRDLSQWLKEGKIKYRVDVVRGLENAPSALNRLFSGENQGKLCVQVTQDSSCSPTAKL